MRITDEICLEVVELGSIFLIRLYVTSLVTVFSYLSTLCYGKIQIVLVHMLQDFRVEGKWSNRHKCGQCAHSRIKHKPATCMGSKSFLDFLYRLEIKHE